MHISFLDIFGKWGVRNSVFGWDKTFFRVPGSSKGHNGLAQTRKRRVSSQMSDSEESRQPICADRRGRVELSNKWVGRTNVEVDTFLFVLVDIPRYRA